MQTDSTTAAANEAAYDSRPWLKSYPPDVRTSVDYPRQTVYQLLQETARHYGARPALLFQNRPITYNALLRYADHFSRGLAALGVHRKDRVLVILPNVPHFPITYYATLRLGAAVAAISPRSVPAEVRSYIQDSGADTIVTLDLLFDGVADVWQDSGVKRVIVGSVADFLPRHLKLAGQILRKVPKPQKPVPYGDGVLAMPDVLRLGQKRGAPQEAEPGDVALLQYTGGTTGLPKAALLTQSNVLANARQTAAYLPLINPGEETIMGVLPFFHVYGVTLVLNIGLLLAATTVLLPRGLDMADIFEAIRRHRPTVFPGVPTIYVSLLNDRRSQVTDMSSIKLCVSGGAPLPLEVKRDFDRMTGGHLLEGYGLSEASPITHAQPYDESGRDGSIGLPYPDTEARIVNADTGEAVPVGEAGELLIRGPQVMQSYWNRPDDTADALRDGWLHTGDIARMDSDGFFYIVDRKKDLIITAGENIYPREIEEVLFEHPKIKEVAVVGVPNMLGGEIAKAFIVLKPGETASKKEMIQFAGQRLSKHKVPRAYEFRDDLPHSAAGKVLRRELQDEERRRQDSRHPGRPRAGSRVEQDDAEDQLL